MVFMQDASSMGFDVSLELNSMSIWWAYFGKWVSFNQSQLGSSFSTWFLAVLSTWWGFMLVIDLFTFVERCWGFLLMLSLCLIVDDIANYVTFYMLGVCRATSTVTWGTQMPFWFIGLMISIGCKCLCPYAADSSAMMWAAYVQTISKINPLIVDD